MHLHVQALYTRNIEGLITGVNQWDGGDVPRFHLARRGTDCAAYFRHDVPLETRVAITELARQEPPTCGPHLPTFHLEYSRLLSKVASTKPAWQGPVYRFTTLPDADDTTVVTITEDNAHLLARYHEDWLPDIVHRQPLIVSVVEGNAVAVCASARITEEAHEAGVETAMDYRRQGYATAAVIAWARAVSQCNAVPLYSTDWHNDASRAVAARLGLELVGDDYQI